MLTLPEGGAPSESQDQCARHAGGTWIVYKSRAHRDGVNKKVMKDERSSAP